MQWRHCGEIKPDGEPCMAPVFREHGCSVCRLLWMTSQEVLDNSKQKKTFNKYLFTGAKRVERHLLEKEHAPQKAYANTWDFLFLVSPEEIKLVCDVVRPHPVARMSDVERWFANAVRSDLVMAGDGTMRYGFIPETDAAFMAIDFILMHRQRLRIPRESSRLMLLGKQRHDAELAFAELGEFGGPVLRSRDD